jgi:hypothetical protein
MADFMVIQCLCVALVLIFPQVAMWFPQWLEAGDRMAVPALREDVPESSSLEAGDSLMGDVDEPRLEK